MFKVGMGESPEMPQDLSEEGKDFVETCLDHDPKERWSAEELLLHNFCKVNCKFSFKNNLIQFFLFRRSPLKMTVHVKMIKKPKETSD